MRLLVILTLIMVAIVGLGFYVEHGLSNLIEGVLSDLDEGESYLSTGQRDAALERLTKAHQKWQKAQHRWNPFIYNTDLDELEAALSRLLAFVETDNFSHAHVELSYIRTRLRQIHQQERLSLQNVL
ncbi:MAG: DUF4363 family protein [Firmicutes bacterium]|jgi:hypothetical protein|nr:DUF4363 family protein [Bacillota bacterium]